MYLYQFMLVLVQNITRREKKRKNIYNDVKKRTTQGENKKLKKRINNEILF